MLYVLIVYGSVITKYHLWLFVRNMFEKTDMPFSERSFCPKPSFVIILYDYAYF